MPDHISAQVHDQSWRSIVEESDEKWFASEEAQAIAENVLLYQRDIGGWPKNVQIHLELTDDDREELMHLKSNSALVTTDNGATTREMQFLAKVYRFTPDDRYRSAFIKGLVYLLESQYDNGGWPQFYPLRKGYYSRITYNDDSMINILRVLKGCKNQTDYFSMALPDDLLRRVDMAVDKGVECILKTQYVQNGILTGWCAQYDEITLEPAQARTYELPALSGLESVGIVSFLMSIENPSHRIKKAVDAAVAWFQKVQINGIREDRTYDQNGKIIRKVMVRDPDAPPIWARFMDLDTNEPFFCDRDGVKKRSIEEIGEERRNGYAWYRRDPQSVLDAYPKWKAKILDSTRHADIYHVVVAKDGSGDYVSIQDAINSSKSYPPKRIKIFVKDGRYYEKVKVHEWNTHLSIIGESKEGTIITYDDYFDKIDLGRNSTFHTYTLRIDANDFIIENITVENSAGPVGQAIALYVCADRVVISNCRLLGHQDTLYVSGKGRQYYRECYIEGTTDFIFGNATALFENCVIHSKKNSYITAASTPLGASYGLVFRNCRLTASEGVTQAYLGRPWREYAQTVFIQCELSDHIRPEGWHDWGWADAHSSVFYAEYSNFGPGAAKDRREAWAHQLSKRASRRYSLDKILSKIEPTGRSSWYLKVPSQVP